MTSARNYRQTRTQRPRVRTTTASQPTTIRNCDTGETHRFDSHQSEIVIGVGSECDIVIRDAYASGRHCTLRRLSSSRWQLRDHGSKNGSRINGTRIAIGELTPGGQLSIGDTSLELLSSAEHPSGARAQLIGNAPCFLDAIALALKAARTSCSVLILGETGTGKELVAQTIHEASRRAALNFVPVNCGAIPEQLVRSELFGHMKGSFTGATADHDGLFRLAHQGTLFLDEIGELPLAQQPQLLRALETGLIRPVGAPLEQLVNTRVVAATNRLCLDPERSPLREDLYHRLSAIVIELPPLRERKQDISLLVQHFLRRGQAEFGPHHVPPRTLKRLSEHEWLGNIRELRNSVSRAMALGSGHLQLQDFLPRGIRRPATFQASLVQSAGPPTRPLTSYQQSQRALIADAYARHGTIRGASAELGLPKSTLADLCKRLGIDTSRSTKRRNRGAQP
jgi:DNA-binding NtrC family response regulator